LLESDDDDDDDDILFVSSGPVFGPSSSSAAGSNNSGSSSANNNNSNNVKSENVPADDAGADKDNTDEKKKPPPTISTSEAASSVAATVGSSTTSDRDDEETLVLIGTSNFTLHADGPTEFSLKQDEPLALVREGTRVLVQQKNSGTPIVGRILEEEAPMLGVVMKVLGQKVKVTATADRPFAFNRNPLTMGSAHNNRVGVTVQFYARRLPSSPRNLTKLDLQSLEAAIRKSLAKGGKVFVRAYSEHREEFGPPPPPPRRVTRSPVPPLANVKSEQREGTSDAATAETAAASASAIDRSDSDGVEDVKPAAMSGNPAGAAVFPAAVGSASSAAAAESKPTATEQGTLLGTCEFDFLTGNGPTGQPGEEVYVRTVKASRTDVMFVNDQGTIVGFLNEAEARALATVMEHYMDLADPQIRVAARVGESPTNVKLSFYPLASREHPVLTLNRVFYLREKVWRLLGGHFRPAHHVKPEWTESTAYGAPVKPDPSTASSHHYQHEMQQMQRFVDPDAALDEALAGLSASASRFAAVAAAAAANIGVMMSEVEWQSQDTNLLDEMFDKQATEKISKLPPYPMPPLLSGVRLFDHQQEGIRWLIHKEKGALPTYFEERADPITGRKTWRCTITKCIYRHAPPPVRGGILSDVMGVGKTLQTIGLILSNPPRGLRYPIPRRLRRITRPTEEAPRCTLIVCPLSVMANWKIEINKHVNQRVANKNLTVAIYHGPNREKLLLQVKHGLVDVLLASYHTLASDYKQLIGDPDENQVQSLPAKKKRKKGLCILDLMFHRCVLDEAHIIRSSSTWLYKAAMYIQADRRLCLTGTPFVNKPTDIHSLLSFLSVQPLSSPEMFRKFVITPIQERKEIGLATIRTTMAHIALRRVKSQVRSSFVLYTTPERIRDFKSNGIVSPNCILFSSK